jgi:phage gp36-like protein
MAWIALTVTEVTTRLAGAEVTALQTAALATAQTDPLSEIIEQVVDEVRGNIAAGGYTVGASQTIPSRLVGAALAIIRYRAATRLPQSGILDDNRVAEYRDALRLLERVADGKFAIEDPVTADTEASGAPGPAMDDAPDNYFTRDEQDGL